MGNAGGGVGVTVDVGETAEEEEFTLRFRTSLTDESAAEVVGLRFVSDTPALVSSDDELDAGDCEWE